MRTWVWICRTHVQSWVQLCTALWRMSARGYPGLTLQLASQMLSSRFSGEPISRTKIGLVKEDTLSCSLASTHTLVHVYTRTPNIHTQRRKNRHTAFFLNTNSSIQCRNSSLTHWMPYINKPELWCIFNRNIDSLLSELRICFQNYSKNLRRLITVVIIY